MDSKSIINFPQISEIPSEFSTQLINEQRHYLADGELIPWHGATEEVYSAVMCVEGEKTERMRLGSCPVLGAEESLRALDAAHKAYDQGRGEWPTIDRKSVV